MHERELGVERLNAGRPIFVPTGRAWESRGAVNPAAVFLDGSESNGRLIRGLLGSAGADDPGVSDGVVVVQYGAVGHVPEATPPYRTSRGLAIFTPDFQLLKCLDRPVLSPSENRNDVDCAGVEDARLSRIGDTYYACYCGFNGQRGWACAAVSTDLLEWKKIGALPGNINVTQNKDHVLLQERIRGRYWMLHRPWGEPLEVNDYAIRLASSEDPLGPWTDCGEILHAYRHPGRKHMWVGAGTVPIPLGEERYLVIYHTGSRFPDGYRRYDACAALFDFSAYDPARPQSIVRSRLEPIMVPETEWERNPDPDLRIDIVFPVGSFVRQGSLYLVYGAGDRYSCAARLPLQGLVERLESSGLENPYVA